MTAWEAKNASSSPGSTVSVDVKSSCSGAIESVIRTETIWTGSTTHTTHAMSARQWRR
jgi:hypothetical protein